jgi:hypothetical protein
MADIAKQYQGTLRPRISIPEPGRVKVEWIDVDTGVVIWTETGKPREGRSFVSQIIASGKFETAPPYEVDSEGKRHFVMACEPGRLGVLGQNLTVGGKKE